jgi:hypothetical protein
MKNSMLEEQVSEMEYEPGTSQIQAELLPITLLLSAIHAGGNTSDNDTKLVATERNCEQHSYVI